MTTTTHSPGLGLPASILCLVATVFPAAGCSSGRNPHPSASPAESARIAVTVGDAEGRFLESVVVTVPATGAVATTDARGRATIAMLTGQERLVRFAKAGFADQFRVVRLPTGTQASALSAVMLARSAAVTLVDVQNGGRAVGGNGASVALSPGALVDAAGTAVSGTVTVSITPLDVRSDLAAAPGRLEGIPEDAERTPIVTWGMTEFEFRQDDKELNLAPGTTAQILLPIFVPTNQDGSPIAAGQRLPLWSLDETTGIWKQEGSGEVVAAPDSPTGFALAATVSHFSWWNVDQARRLSDGREPFRARVVCKLAGENGESARDLPAGAAAQVTITVGDGGPRSVATTTVPAGGSDEFIPSGVPVRFDAQVAISSAGTFLVATGSLRSTFPEGGAGTVEILLSAAEVPAPTIREPADTIATNSESPVTVEITLDGPVPDAVELSVDGRLLHTFPPQFFYRFFWDTRDEREGLRALVATAIVGSARRPSAVRFVNVDRTPPQVVQITPSAGSEVSGRPIFDVQFSEPVLPFPLRLQDVVVLSFTLNGGGPEPRPMTAMLLQRSTILHVESVDLVQPFGAVGLSWGGLRDVAGNAVTGTVAATWAVVPATRSLPQLAHLGDGLGPLSVAVSGAGTAFVLHSPRSDAVTVSRYEEAANVWTELPVVVQSGSFVHALTVDSTGAPVVAVTTLDQATNEIEYAVKRFDGNGWAPLGQAFRSSTRFPLRASSVGLAFDALGRPILAHPQTSDRIVVRRLDPATQSYTVLDQPLGFRNDPSIRVDDAAVGVRGDGNPVVAWRETRFGAATLLAAEFDGTRWHQLGGFVDTRGSQTGGLSAPSIAVGSSFHVTYISRSSLVMRRWDGSAWVDIGFPSRIIRSELPPRTSLRNDKPILAYGTGVLLSSPEDVLVHVLDGATWSPAIRARGPSVSTRATPELAVGGGRVFVTHKGSDSLAEIVEVLFP